jgi:hypothetical protein
MWGFPDGSFYAVGEAGTVLRHDGATTSLVDVPTREDLRGIWASGPGDIYVCGLNGTLIHFNGSTWLGEKTPTKKHFYAVWASGTDDVFVAGADGIVWNWHDGTWTDYSVVPGQRLVSIWGYTHDEVYVGGSRGALYRFDGSRWTRVIIFGDPTIDVEIYDLWGPAPGAISLVDRWNILWFDGSTWNGIQVVQSNGLGLWGFALNQQIAVSDQVSTHWVNGQRTSYPTPTSEPLFDVWGTSMSNCFAVGRSGSMAHFDGAAWEAINEESLVNLHDIHAYPGGAIAVGTAGTVLRHNGAAWAAENVDPRYELAGVWETNGLTVAVGRYAPNNIDWNPAILMNTGGGWTDAGVVGNAHRLFDVWGSGPTDVYAVGWAGEILHYDGGAWAIADPGSGDAAFLTSVSGTSPDNVLAVGRTDDLRGLACYFDGSLWTKATFGGVQELRGAWMDGPGSAFAVGSAGAIRRLTEGSWSTMTSPTKDELFCIWGSSASDVYAAGWQGALIHFDGTSWRKLLPATNRTIHAISGLSANDVFFAGDTGSILFFDGL